MTVRSGKLRLAGHVICVVFLASAQGATAGPCDSGVAGACDVLQGRVNRTLAADPAQQRSNRLNGGAAQDATAPFAVNPEGPATNFATSLTQWGSAFSAADARAIEEAKSGFAKNMALPKPAKPKAPALDVWAESRREEQRQIAEGKQADTTTTYLGADYKLHSDVLLGAMVQLDDARQSALSTGDGIKAEAYMAGPYVTYKATPHLTLGARAAWGGASDSTSSSTASTNFATSRALTQAHVTGNWGWGKWQLNQSAAVSYINESAAAASASLGDASVAVTRFTAGPEIKRPIDAGLGNNLEPFAFFKTSLELDDPRVRAGVARNTLGGGVMLTKPDTYSLRATAERSAVTGNGEAPEELAGNVSVSVPLP